MATPEERTLSDDLKKETSKIIDGFKASVEGMIHQTFGPLGGFVNAFTVGFINRAKENASNEQKNLTANEKSAKHLESIDKRQQAQLETDEERQRRTEVMHQENLSALTGLKDSIGKGSPSEGDGFLMTILKVLGLVGAGLAGAVVGIIESLRTHSLKFLINVLTDLARLIGKGFDAIKPKFIDDIIQFLKGDGTVGGFFQRLKNFFVGEESIFRKVGSKVDEIVEALKNFTGSSFDKVKNFFVGEENIFKKIGSKVDEVVDALKNFTGSSFDKVKNFFVGESSIFRKVGGLIDSAIEATKGFSGNALTKITDLFKFAFPNTFGQISTMVDDLLDVLPTGGAKEGGGIISRFFNGVKNIFTSLKSTANSLLAPFEGIFSLFGIGAETVGEAGKKAGLVDDILKFLNPLKGVFNGMKSLAKTIGGPLNIILGLLDAGFETADAVSKSEGFFATLLNGILGAIGGFIDGAVAQVADFLKDGVSAVVGFLGFEEAEKALDSFSFSEIWNNVLDSIYKGVNKIFNAPGEFIDDVGGFFGNLFGKSDTTGAAKGGVIVNRPSYLPSSGVVVGESTTFRGGFAGGGAIPLDGGPEAIIPMNQGALQMISRPIAGSILNELQMGRVGGIGATVNAPNVIDNSTNVVNNNNTTVSPPNPYGRSLPGEGRDKGVSHFRHVA